MAPALADYVVEMGFTHVEFLPLKEHPYGPSWGYQVSNYFAPSARYGTPDDLRYLIDYLHQRGIGVIMDWVPAHFPKDAFALGAALTARRFTNISIRAKASIPTGAPTSSTTAATKCATSCWATPSTGARSFISTVLRVDAVASMLYLDYSRKEGEWVPNEFGGRENLEAIIAAQGTERGDSSRMSRA